MDLLPLALDVRGRRLIVVGGGRVAERKVSTLLASGADVKVIAPDATPALRDWAADGRVEWSPRAYAPGDLTGAALAFAATDSREVNRAVADEARALGIWCNVAAPPQAGDAQMMATIERGAVTIAIGTGGASPYVARRLRERVETAVPPELGRLADLIGELRDEVKTLYSEEVERRAAYCRMWDSGALTRLRDGDEAGARELLRACLR